MASSHSGEDLHVRTLQAMYRRAGVSQTLIATGSEGMPLDALTAARLARDGEKASPVRHMCSGQHSVFLLLSRLKGWDPEAYWLDGHPAQVAYRRSSPGRSGRRRTKLRTSIDGCGVPTYAFPLREIARAYAFLADPTAVPASDPRSSLAPSLVQVRDAMLANPEMVGGSRERLDTSLMKARRGPRRQQGRDGGAPRAGPPARLLGVAGAAASGIALKVEDGDGYERGTWAATVEVLRPGRRARRPGAPRPGALSPAGRPGPARPGRGGGDRRLRARAGGRADLGLAGSADAAGERSRDAMDAVEASLVR